jgi:hypothetical protein
MSPDLIKRVTEGTFAELYPYYAHSEILDNVQYDYYKDASLDHLRNYLSQIYWMLLYFRKIYMDQASESMVPSAPTVP